MGPSLELSAGTGSIESPLGRSLERRSSRWDSGASTARGNDGSSRGGDDCRFCIEASGDGIVAISLELSPLRNGLLKAPSVRFSGDVALPEDCVPG